MTRPAAGRSASPSTAPPTARPSCSRSPTPTSRRPSCAGRRARSTRRRGAATPAPRGPARPGKEIATGVTLPFSLETATVSDLQARMTAGTLNAVTLTKAYMERIARTNTEGPSLNAVRLINPKALAEAAAMDAERAAGHTRGPLHGIPVLVKDNLDAAGLPTTAGSVALENSIPDKDSPVVAQAACGGRGPARQAQPVRVRQLPLQRADAERVLEPRRAGAEPLQRGHHAERLVERVRRRGRLRASPRSRSGPRRAARSPRPPPRRATSGCGRPSAWSAGQASCRSPPRRTRRARSPAPSPTPRRSSGRSRARTRRTRPPTPRRPPCRTTSPASRPTRWPASGSASSPPPTRSTRPPSRSSRRSARRP